MRVLARVELGRGLKPCYQESLKMEKINQRDSTKPEDKPLEHLTKKEGDMNLTDVLLYTLVQ